MEQRFDYEEMEAFKGRSKKIDNQISKLKRKKEKLLTKFSEVGKEYNDLTYDITILGIDPDEKKMYKLQKEKGKIQDEIKHVEELITTIEGKREEALLELVPELYAGYQRERDILSHKMELMKENVVPQVAKYLATITKLGNLNEQLNQLRSEFKSQARKATTKYEDYRDNASFNEHTGKIFLFGHPYDKEQRIGVTEEDQKRALVYGTLPWSIQLYNLTGEFEPIQEDARRKYHQALKEAEQK